MVEHRCTEKVWGDYRDVPGRAYPCSRRGTVERDGKWYCWQHDPERVKADDEKRRAEWRAEMDRKKAKWTRQAAMSRVCKGVSTEDLGRLEVGAVSRLLDDLEVGDVRLECPNCWDVVDFPIVELASMHDGMTIACPACDSDVTFKLIPSSTGDICPICERPESEHEAIIQYECPIDEFPPGNYKRARGTIPWREGDEMPEAFIRRLRDATPDLEDIKEKARAEGEKCATSALNWKGTNNGNL